MGDLSLNIVETIHEDSKNVLKEPSQTLHLLALLPNAKENWKQRTRKGPTPIEKKLEKKLLHKDEKLHELRSRCAHLLKVEKCCNDLHNELNLKKEHVEVLTKSQACMQQQVDNTERKHTEDLTLLVRALEKSKLDLGSQGKLIEILVHDLQKMKSTLEYCKDELLLKDQRVSVLEEDLRKAKYYMHSETAKTPSKIHQAPASNVHTSKRKFMIPRWQPLPITLDDIPENCKHSSQKERSELESKVAKLTREGELWTFEKAMLVSALHTAKKEFNYQHQKLNLLQEKLQKMKSSSVNNSQCLCKTRHCHRVVEKHHHHCTVCRKMEVQADESSNHLIISLREQLRKQMQLHYNLEEKLKSTKKKLSYSNKKLKTADLDRAKMSEQLAHAHMRSYDMEYQMALLHDSLLESSARLEHVTSQLRESSHHKVSVQKSLECSLVSLQEASVDVVLENSAKELEFKSMKLLQRLMATRLRWGHTIATDSQLLIEN